MLVAAREACTVFIQTLAYMECLPATGCRVRGIKTMVTVVVECLRSSASLVFQARTNADAHHAGHENIECHLCEHSD